MKSISLHSYLEFSGRNNAGNPGFRWLKCCLACVLITQALLHSAGILAAESDKPTLTDFIAHVDENFQKINETALRDAAALGRTAEDAGVMIQFLMTYYKDEYEYFTDGSGCGYVCEDFRGELVAFINHYQNTLNLTPKALGAMAAIQGLPPMPEVPPVNLSPLAELLDQAPGFLIFPFYDALSLIRFNGSDTSLPQLNTIFADAENALTDLVAVGNSVNNSFSGISTRSSSSTGSSENVNTLACQVLVAEPYAHNGELTQFGAATITTLSGILSAVSDVLYIKSLNQFNQFNAGMGFVGSLNETTNINMLDKLSAALSVTSKVFEGVGVGLSTTINRCRVRLNNQLMFCMLKTRNLHNNRTFNTLDDCFARVKSGTEPFGFNQ